MATYYNEIDAFAAAWLRELIGQGLIPPGDVDERSIEDVVPADLRGYAQCHFFAGIGIWPYALRQAGWPDDRPVWTGSCPCQPFSAAGKGEGFADERHLWPAWHHLIGIERPAVVFGEQVESKDGYPWIDLVHTDMEACGYAFAPIVLCSAGFGSPNIRHRFYFVAERLGDAEQPGLEGHPGAGGNRDQPGRLDKDTPRPVTEANESSRLADSERERHDWSGAAGTEGRQECGRTDAPGYPGDAQPEPAGPTNGFWRTADWLFCRDGKWRAVESGTFPLATRPAARVGRLRGYGNGINVEVATEFVKAYLQQDKG